MLSKKPATVDKTQCVACGVCENTYPLGFVKVRRGCYAAVEAERCVGYGKCAKLCPVGCIEVNARAEAGKQCIVRVRQEVTAIYPAEKTVTGFRKDGDSVLTLLEESEPLRSDMVLLASVLPRIRIWQRKPDSDSVFVAV